MTRPFPWQRAGLCLVPVLALVLAYLPDLGHGFVKDDFAWIEGSRVSAPSRLWELFQRQNGFYRPVVSLSFALNERLSGLQPFPYGLTNLLLVLAAMALLYRLGRALGMPWGGAALATALWALNPHGVGGAILWISGRTSLLLIVFALGAALALTRGHAVLAAALAALALFSKEEAVLLPAILFVWAGLVRQDDRVAFSVRRALPWALASLVPLLLYFVLRSRTAAFLPLSAPAYYRLTFSPALVGRNVLEYADRSATLAAAVLLLAMAAARRRPRLDAAERDWVLRGLAWLVGGFGITVFVPVRSSLYACFPSIGTALAGAALVHSVWRQASPRVRAGLQVAAVILPFALLPVYRSRNARMARTAELSARVLEAVGQRSADLAAGRVLVLHDDPGSKVTLRNAFGTLITEAVRLRTGVAAPRVWIEPPLPEWEQAGLRRPDGPSIEVALREGQVVPVAP